MSALEVHKQEQDEYRALSTPKTGRFSHKIKPGTSTHIGRKNSMPIFMFRVSHIAPTFTPSELVTYRPRARTGSSHHRRSYYDADPLQPSIKMLAAGEKGWTSEAGWVECCEQVNPCLRPPSYIRA